MNERDLTMIGQQRMFSNILIAKWITQNELDGDFVECGVWRGGSTLLVKMILKSTVIIQKFGCSILLKA